MLENVLLALIFASAGIGFLLGHVAWRRTEVPGGRTYAVHMVVHGLWSLFYGGQLASDSATGMAVFDAATATASVFAAFTWLVFVLEYTGRTEWLSPRRLAPMFAQPAAYAALYVTNPVHGLVYDAVTVERGWGVSYVVVEGSSLFYLQILVIYTVLAVGVALLGSFVLRSRNLYRRQTATILIAALVVIAGNLLWVASLEGGENGLDLTPLFFGVNGIVIGWALFRYDFLNLVPVAADTLIEAMDDPVLVFDDERRLIDYNRSAQAVFSLEDDDFEEPIEPLLADVDAETERSVRVTGGSIERNDGDDAIEPERGDAVYQPSRTALTDHRDVTRGELIVFRDVTAQKRREADLEELQAGTRDLMEAETREAVAAATMEKARSILGDPFVGVLLYDDEREELVSASLSDETYLELEDKEMCVDGGIVWETYERGETRILGRDALGRGQYAHLPLEAVLLYPLADHGVIGVGIEEGADVAFSDDDVRLIEILGLTAEAAMDRAAREEELEARRAELAERNERLDEFANVVSHDLRNPLNTADGYLELARSASTGGDEHFDRIESAHARMKRLIDDVLTLARQGTDVTDPDPVAVADAARAAWGTAGAQEGHLEVEIDAVVRADEQRLRTVFENLFRNAREHAGEQATVTVGADEDRLFVADDGPGIDPDRCEEVFERGYSTRADGTGFGLSIVERIATAHGWTISVGESAAGGAVFTFHGVEFED
ncbi:histidine kinase N-terminal 7TM domain-containing protein [Halopiger aswanensis]|uniref:histidine kinase n=1 Tax=Halopiger aswanensis TaxID=148449 RepID=A0A3R7D9B2_9EURY|nr:histidine kinase N-terminal 7TM domain-containing protein [Halopiger aswanensis]RKD94653.1 K+-sensing histidine kinase KdpD [Halopiger aswanensis]